MTQKEIENKEKKILLIYPGLDPCPPYKLLQIAAVLEKNGIEVLITDFCHQSLKNGMIIKKRLKSLNIDIVGIYFRIESFSNILRIIRMAKNLNKIVIIIGSGYKEMMKLFLRDSNVDFVTASGDQLSLLSLLNCLFSGKNMARVKGIGFKKNGIPFLTKNREYVSLDRLPMPAWHLIDIDSHLGFSVFGPTIYMETSEGCPYNCTYCKLRLSQGPIRYKSIKKSIDEVEYVLSKSRKAKAIFFQDLTFLFNKDRVINFCNELIRRDIKISWFCYGRIRDVNEEMLKKLKEANCKAIIFGVESGSQKIQKKLGKKVSLNKIKKVFELCKFYDINPGLSVILGIPGERIEDLQKTLNFIKIIKPSYIIPHLFLPVPGLKLTRIAESYGLTQPKSLDEWEISMHRLPNLFPTPKETKRMYFRLCIYNDLKLFFDSLKNLGIKTSLKFLLRQLQERTLRIVDGVNYRV